MEIDPSRLEQIVRRHVHDVKNHSNGLSLEVSLLLELVTDRDALESLRRMGSRVAELESSLRGLMVMLIEQPLVEFNAADLFDMWRGRVAPMVNSSQAIEWTAPGVSKAAMMDPAAIVWVLRELTIDAWKNSRSSPLQAAVITTPEGVIAELRQPAGVMSQVINAELINVVERNGGVFTRVFELDSSKWVTRLSFKVAGPSRLLRQ